MAGGAGAAGTTTLGAKIAAGIASGAIVVASAGVTFVSYDAMAGLTTGLRANELYQQMRRAQQPTTTSSAEATGGGMYDGMSGLSGEPDSFVLRDATLTGKLVNEYDQPAFPITIRIHSDGTVDGTVSGSYTRAPPGYATTKDTYENGSFTGTIDAAGRIDAEGRVFLTMYREAEDLEPYWAPFPWDCLFELDGEVSPDYAFAGEAVSTVEKAANGEDTGSGIGSYFAVSATE